MILTKAKKFFLLRFLQNSWKQWEVVIPDNCSATPNNRASDFCISLSFNDFPISASSAISAVKAFFYSRPERKMEINSHRPKMPAIRNPKRPRTEKPNR